MSYDNISGFADRILRQIRLKKVSKFINGCNLLDLGCGIGKLLNYLPKNINYVGIDRDIKAINEAKIIHHNNSRFICADLEEYYYSYLRHKTFDYIIISATLEHITKPKSLLKYIRQFLSKDGKIIITVPSVRSEDLLNWLSKIKLINRKNLLEHKHYFTKTKLYKLAKMGGYKIIKYNVFEFGLNQLAILNKNGNT